MLNLLPLTLVDKLSLMLGNEDELNFISLEITALVISFILPCLIDDDARYTKHVSLSYFHNGLLHSFHGSEMEGKEKSYTVNV